MLVRVLSWITSLTPPALNQCNLRMLGSLELFLEFFELLLQAANFHRQGHYLLLQPVDSFGIASSAPAR